MMDATLCGTLGAVWEDGAPDWMPDLPEGVLDEGQLQAVSRYELDLSQQLASKPKRLLHSLSVGLTAERMAVAYGADPYLARVAGILHDWAKLLSPEETLARARELGLDLGVDLELVEPLLHGMIAARELPERYPELPAEVWQAIDRHTLGNAHMSPLDMVVFVADGIEPRRRAVPPIERQRAMLAERQPLEDLYLTSLSDGISYVINTRRYLFPGTLAIYDDIVLARAGAGKGR